MAKDQGKKVAPRVSGGAKQKVAREASQLKFVASGSYAKRRVTKSKALAFGSVVIEAPRGVTPAERRANILAGQEALKRAKTALARPGVMLDLAPEIPRYHVDAQGRLVRVLGEKKQIGKLVNGAFVEND